MYSILWFAELLLVHLQGYTGWQGTVYISWLMSKNSMSSDANCPDQEHNPFDLAIDHHSSYRASFK